MNSPVGSVEKMFPDKFLLVENKKHTRPKTDNTINSHSHYYLCKTTATCRALAVAERMENKTFENTGSYSQF